MCYDGKCSWQHTGIAPQEQGKSLVRMENVLESQCRRVIQRYSVKRCLFNKVSALKSHQ